MRRLIIIALILLLIVGVGYSIWRRVRPAVTQLLPGQEATATPTPAATPPTGDSGSNPLAELNAQGVPSPTTNSVGINSNTTTKGGTSSFTVGNRAISFSLPSSITQATTAEQSSSQGEKGTQICQSFKRKGFSLIPQVYAGGAACFPGIFTVGAITSDYEAGRETGFSDLTGYGQRGQTYFIKGMNGREIAIDNSLVTLVKNRQGVEMLKVRGRNASEDSVFPVGGTPGNGRVGAIINLTGSNFPAVTLDMELSPQNSEAVFDQILQSVIVK